MSINNLSHREFDKLAKRKREREALAPAMSKRAEIERIKERKELELLLDDEKYFEAEFKKAGL